MYEYMTGMGYSAVPPRPGVAPADWLRNYWSDEPETEYLPCIDRGGSGDDIRVCFTDTPEQRAIARDYDCVRLGWPCNDEGTGASGGEWCCPRLLIEDQPTQPGRPVQETPGESPEPTPPSAVPEPAPSTDDTKPSPETGSGQASFPWAPVLGVSIAAAGAFLGYVYLERKGIL